MSAEQGATRRVGRTGPDAKPGINERVQAELDRFLACREAELVGIDKDLAPQIEAVTALIRGGKRIRPAFCYWGWRGAGAPDAPEIIPAAAALELLQVSALIHDDLIDGSETRRGQPAAHRRFTELHKSHDWHGPAEQFGFGAAILLGDLCLSWSEQLLRECGIDPARLLPGLACLDIMRTEVMAGQYLDLVNQAARDPSLPSAMRVVRYKAAKYTVERPLHLGGTLAGAAPELLEAYSAYGLPLGEAFQLRDDILGVFGDPRVTGKPAGDDLREGKRTVLVANALAAADERRSARFNELFGSPALDARGVDELREIIVETGALAGVERLIGELTASALGVLAEPSDPSETGLPGEARSALRDLAAAATQRVS